MECYECAIRGEAIAAVATCRHCGVGLCLDHLAEAQRHRPGNAFGCPHDLNAAGTPRERARVVEGNGHARVPAGTRR